MKRSLLVVCLLASVLFAQDERKGELASLVPQNTVLLVEFDDLGGFERWTKETALGRMWMEPEVQYFAQNFMASFQKAVNQWGGMLGMVGLAPADFDGIEIRRMGLAVVDVAMKERVPDIDVVFTVQLRKGGAKVQKILNALRGAVATFAPQVPIGEIQLRGRTVNHVELEGVNVFWTTKDDRFVLTTKRERMNSVLAAVDEGAAQSLRTAPRFKNIMNRMGVRRSAATVYADLKVLKAKGVALARQSGVPDRDVAMFEKVWTTLGLDALEAVAFADVPQGTGFRTELAVTYAGERRGLLRLAASGKVNHRFARYAPADALYYGSSHWNAAEAFQAVVDMYVALERRGGERVEQFYGMVKEALDVDLQTEILAALGDDWAGHLGMPPEGGIIPDLCLFVTVKDKAKLEGAFEKMARRIPGLAKRQGADVAFKETLFRGLRIRYMEGDEIPLAPAWAFGDDYLVLALNPHAIRNAFVEKPALAGTEDFRALTRAVPETASSATYLNTKAVVAWCYNTIVPVLQSAQGAINAELKPYGFQLNFTDLPPAHVITKHMSGTMFYSASEPGCLRMGYVSPFGSMLVIGGVAAAAAGAAVVMDIERQQRFQRQMAVQRAMAQRRRAELERRRAQQERARYERRIAAMEKQLEELRKLIEQGGGGR